MNRKYIYNVFGKSIDKMRIENESTNINTTICSWNGETLLQLIAGNI